MSRIQGMPFLPGSVQGRLQTGTAGDLATAILALTQQELPFQGQTPCGLIVIGGAPFSHPMLRLRALGVPIVAIEPSRAGDLPYGEMIRLDGGSGLISTDVSEPAIAEPPPAGTRLTTDDGTRIQLYASIGGVSGATAAVSKNAAGIGLVRSEYLFPPSSQQPDAAFMTAALRQICEAAHPLAVTVRLLDIADDKRPPWLGELPGVGGVLGLQGARLYGIEPVRNVFHAELDAIAELADQYDLRMLIPYLTRLEELEHWRHEIRARVPTATPLGAMLETPAAAMAVADWLKVADFVALGCNDLMQCIFGADRDQPALRHLLDPYCPTLYRFLRQVALEADAATGTILVCGLLSQLPGVLPLLVGLGYRRFSVDPAMIPWLADTVRRISLQDARTQAAAACAARHSAEVRELLRLPAA